MTVILREYIPQTRELKTLSGDMGGVVNDSESTTIQITYPEGYLDDKNAYIAFTVTDPETNEPFWYSFNGYSFEIPYDVASRVEHNKLGYQLILVGKTNSGYVEQSVIDTCMFARAITDYPDTPLSSVKGIQELNYYRDEVLSKLRQLETLIQNSTGGGTIEVPDYSTQLEQISNDISSRAYELSSTVGDIPEMVAQRIVPPPDYGNEINSIYDATSQISGNISSMNSDIGNISTSLANIDSTISGSMGSLSTDIMNIGSNVENLRMDLTDSSSGVGGKIDYVYIKIREMENASPGGSLKEILESIAGTVDYISQRLDALEGNNP